MWIKIILWFILSFFSTILYRAGGTNAFNTKFRDIGCALCVTLLLMVLGFKSILPLVFTFGLTFASLTTYFKKKGQPAKLWNWVLVGLAFGLAAFPYAFATGHWIGFAIRTIFLVFTVSIWSDKIGDVILEEAGRGFLITASVPFLLI